MVERVNIPVASVPIIRPDGKPVLIEKPWYQLLQGLAKAHNDLADASALDTDLASEVAGVLPVANGGTGKATLSTYRVLAGGTTATGSLQQVGPAAPAVSYNLTVQEKKVLQLLVEGKSYKMIAAELFVAFDTIKSHIRNIYAKLHVNSGTEAVSLALRDKIV